MAAIRNIKYDPSWKKFGMGTPFDMFKGAFKGKADLHFHSGFSDGNPTIQFKTIARAAKFSGIEIVSLTDHESTEGLQGFMEACKTYKLPLISGVEMYVKLPDGQKIDILGYGFNVKNIVLKETLRMVTDVNSQHVLDLAKMIDENLWQYHTVNPEGLTFPAIIGHGEKVFTSLEMDEMRTMALAGRGLTIGVLTRLLIEKKYFPLGMDNKKIDIHALKYVQALPVKPSIELTITEAISLIHKAGGLAFIAHPFGQANSIKLAAKKASMDPYDYMDVLFKKEHIDGIEVAHSDHDSTDTLILKTYAKEKDKLISGGSDTHWWPTGRPFGISPIKALEVQPWMLERQV